MITDTPHAFPLALSRRSLLLAALGAPALAGLLAACGDDTKQSDTSSTSSSTIASTSADAIAHPTGADEIVVRFGFVGGFTTPGAAFLQVPNVLVTGDGRLIAAGASTMIYPGPLLPVLNERSISEAGIQALLAAAEEAGLLEPPADYSTEILVADVPDTRVEINANGATYVHQAPAIGYDEPAETEPRKALRTFTERLEDIVALVGAEHLGEEAPLVAERYRIQTMPVGEEELAGFETEPTIVEWPLADVSLAAAAECLEIAADAAGSIFVEAKQDTLFRETTAAGAQVYRIAAIASLPGDSC